MCDESSEKSKRTFVEAWLTDDRYKSWIEKVPFNNDFYHCNICDKNYSCTTAISRHAVSSYHKKQFKTKSLLSSLPIEIKPPRKNRKFKFQQSWLDIKDFKYWLCERVTQDKSSVAHCIVCDKSIVGDISHIYSHAKSKTHINKCKNNSNEISEANENSNEESNESLLTFDERRKEAEIRYAALIADKNIPYETANEILNFFKHIGQDPNVLKSMSMGRTKCRNIVTKVLCPIETERVVKEIQNTKFTIFINETPDICNKKWMSFLVRYVDSETLDVHTQLVKLIDMNSKDSSAEKLFRAFKCEMWKLQIPFSNVIALSCDNASVMTRKSFKKELEKVCPQLLTFSCPCHSAASAAHAACNKLPAFCEKFIRKVANYINCNPKRSAAFRKFSECYQKTNRRILKLRNTRWLSYYLCVERLLESWDTIKNFLNEIVVNEETNSREYLLSIMDNVETKAYFLFLKYILNIFNAFNAFFQVVETRIHLLQSKSLDFLSQICRHFLKDEHLEPLFINTEFSLKNNQKTLNEISLGSECDKYLDELMKQGHKDEVTTVRENCLTFYVTAAEEICKRLPVDNIFLSKLKVFTPLISLLDTDREESFNDVSFIAETISDFDEDALKEEWIALPLNYTVKEKLNFLKLNFDNMWRKILKCQHPNNIPKYPNLRNVLNAVRSLPNSNADLEKMFSFLNNLKIKNRHCLTSDAVNAICVFKSALKARRETSVNMIIVKKHLSFMSTDKLYATKKNPNTLRCCGLHTADIDDINDNDDIDDIGDIAGPSWAD